VRLEKCLTCSVVKIILNEWWWDQTLMKIFIVHKISKHELMETDQKHCELCSTLKTNERVMIILRHYRLVFAFHLNNTSVECKYPVTLYNGWSSGSQPYCYRLSPDDYLLSLSAFFSERTCFTQMCLSLNTETHKSIKKNSNWVLQPLLFNKSEYARQNFNQSAYLLFLFPILWPRAYVRGVWANPSI